MWREEHVEKEAEAALRLAKLLASRLVGVEHREEDAERGAALRASELDERHAQQAAPNRAELIDNQFGPVRLRPRRTDRRTRSSASSPAAAAARRRRGAAARRRRRAAGHWRHSSCPAATAATAADADAADAVGIALVAVLAAAVARAILYRRKGRAPSEGRVSHGRAVHGDAGHRLSSRWHALV